MARRPKPPDKLHDDIYSVRLTPEISQRLTELAARSGRRRSEVVRSLIEDGEVRQTAIPEANLEVLPDLRRLGGLLNQIARRLHRGQEVEVWELRRTCRELARSFAGLRKKGL